LTRLVAFVFHNWPLKVAAVVLATVLYGVLALSTNAREWPGELTIDVVHQPESAVLLGPLPTVANVRYFAPPDVATRVSRATFHAQIDLAGAEPDANGFVNVAVTVDSSDGAIRVIDWSPRQLRVRLDPLRTKTVPVVVDHGTVPNDLQVRDPVLDVTEVTVSGSESIVSQVTDAVARVRIDPSGVSVDQSVDLIAVDARGEPVAPVRLAPSSVHVKILVGSQLESKALPVNAVVNGTPATGFNVLSVTIKPLVVSIEGDALVLATMPKVDTAPISVSGASADVNQTVPLSLPAGLSALGPAQVQVSIHIGAVKGTRTFSAGMVLSGARDDRTYALSTDQVIVTLGGSISDLDALQGGGFTLTIDVDGLAVGSHDIVPRVNLPTGVVLVALSPPRVTVVVGVPSGPSPSPSGP
jgi:YbbR domain-containing protein